ncbi:CU044_2847 family protein [Streptomyces eurythermus]
MPRRPPALGVGRARRRRGPRAVRRRTPARGSHGGARLPVARSLGSAPSSVRDASSTILARFRDAPVRPDRTEGESGVRLSTEAGAVIAKSGLDGHLTVELSWEGGRAARE